MPSHRRTAHGGGRDSLIRATIEVVGDQGLAKASVRTIAERAGVNSALIAHHFGSRGALIDAAAKWAFEETQRTVNVSIQFALDETGRSRFLKLIQETATIQAFQFEMLLAARRQPGMFDVIDQLYEFYIDSMQSSLRDCGFPHDRALARLVFAALDGLVLQQLSRMNLDEIRASLKRFGEVLRAYQASEVDSTMV